MKGTQPAKKKSKTPVTRSCPVPISETFALLRKRSEWQAPAGSAFQAARHLAEGRRGLGGLPCRCAGRDGGVLGGAVGVQEGPGEVHDGLPPPAHHHPGLRRYHGHPVGLQVFPAGGGQEGFLVRTTTTSAEDATARANQVTGDLGLSTDSFEVTTIGPDWGTSVIQSSCIAFFVSLLLIIAFISVRFRDPKMGVSAVIALLHDLVIVLGVYVLVGREVTPNTIAALLTILGYSLYDTVVVFHRINDNMKGEDIKCTFMTMANHSINQVLVRTINTTLTSLIPVLAMLIFGGETLRDFALAMTVGLVCGCYSSYAIATPIYVMWKTREPQFAKLQKKYGTDIQRWFLNRLPQAAAAAGTAADAAADNATGQDAAATSAASQGQQAASKPAKTQNRSKKKRKKVQG